MKHFIKPTGLFFLLDIPDVSVTFAEKENRNYNVLYTIGYVNGKTVAKDYIVLNNLPKASNFDEISIGFKRYSKIRS
ncbi:hypothetical protein [Mariniflexile sp. HMF6888]|uniref:hypothetical protein n=1 Tax=Mariniflexile sp. HMF6888 TaxID=3373086 RepID=UPI003787A637